MDEHPSTPTRSGALSDEGSISAKTLTTMVYALQAASFLVGFTNLIAIVINYVKRDVVTGTWLESHFRWQICTFWFGLLWAVIGMVTIPLFIGWLILPANALWLIYRIVKGWLCLNDGKAMYAMA